MKNDTRQGPFGNIQVGEHTLKIHFHPSKKMFYAETPQGDFTPLEKSIPKLRESLRQIARKNKFSSSL